MDAAAVEKELKKHGSKTKAQASAWFFKTGEGQYGYGDIFIGVTVPEQRKVAKTFSNLGLNEIKNLLNSPLHECRLTALLILVGQYKKADEKNKAKIAKFYLSNRSRINNWDLVDSSAGYILGNYLLDKDREILFKLSTSKRMWDRRVAIIATQAFIAQNDFSTTLELAKLYLNEDEDLMHKATGWMLREIGKKSKRTLVKFLNANVHLMPRTTLRYAIEHFSDAERKKYLAVKRSIIK
ncbi:MAG: DNA alkylation repair protein [Acidimicrobiia bacterium]